MKNKIKVKNFLYIDHHFLQKNVNIPSSRCVGLKKFSFWCVCMSF